MRQWIGSALVQIIACRLVGAKPLSQPVLGYCQLDPLGTNFNEILIKIQNFFIHKNQAWEWVAMKKNENILQGGTPRKIKIQIYPFGAFWCILFNYKNGLRRPKKRKSVKKLKTLMPEKCIWKYRLPKWRPFCPGGDESNSVILYIPPSAYGQSP